MLWLAANREILRGASLLHFAPETCLEKTLRPLVRHYQSADISGYADLKLNIESLELPDASHDVIVCCHVLEHVNDRLALSELYRVLAPGGTVLIMVPVVQGWKDTYEDPAITTPELRYLHFGQGDHLRYFGADICDRIRAAGFDLETFTGNGSDSVTYSLIRGDTLFVCRRAAKS
jgi:SAM-dependent methyltransferase